jgi:DNA repair exonuclease SbcCD ATPase subunit
MDNRLLEISHELFDGEGQLLSEEEKLSVKSDYETAITRVNRLNDECANLQTQLSNADSKLVCPECNRPFDNMEEHASHVENLDNKLLVAQQELTEAKQALDGARAEAKLVEEYERIENSLDTLRRNTPKDPEEVKQQLEAKLAKAKKEHKEAQVDAESVKVEYESTNLELNKYLKLKEEQDSIRIANKEVESKKKELGLQIDNLDLECSHIKERIEDLKRQETASRIPELEEDLKKKSDRYAEASKKLSIMEGQKEEVEKALEVRKFWLKALAANGLKAYIFKAMLDELNQYTKKYGDKLGCSIRFSLDLDKASTPFQTICSLGDRINKDYKEFSGGQKQRLDIVLMFAMHDLLSSSTQLSLLIMDEVFEGLDEQGESDVFELIREKAEGKSVFVISHSQVLDTLYSKTIEITESNGKTILP